MFSHIDQMIHINEIPTLVRDLIFIRFTSSFIQLLSVYVQFQDAARNKRFHVSIDIYAKAADPDFSVSAAVQFYYRAERRRFILINCGAVVPCVAALIFYVNCLSSVTCNLIGSRIILRSCNFRCRKRIIFLRDYCINTDRKDRCHDQT